MHDNLADPDRYPLLPRSGLYRGRARHQQAQEAMRSLQMPHPSVQEGPSQLLKCTGFQSCLSSWLPGAPWASFGKWSTSPSLQAAV